MPCRQEWLWERIAGMYLAGGVGGGGFQGFDNFIFCLSRHFLYLPERVAIE